MSSELSVILKATIVLVSAALLTMGMRRASASARHVVWASALLAALAVPAASTLLPSIDLPLLPQQETALHGESVSAASPAIVFERSSAAPVVPRETATAPEAPTPLSMTIPWTWRTWLALAWGLGSFVVAAGWLAAVWSLHRLKLQSQPLLDEKWTEVLEEVRRDLGVQDSVRLRIADDAVPPMTWGIFRPVILLPAMARTWSPMRRRLVLAHEMAHVKRNDGLGQVLAQAACSVYWFNPAIWYAVHRLYVEREHACDDAVLRLGAPAADYADHLLQIARGMNSRFALTAVAMAHPSELKSRITAILALGSNRQRASRIAVAALLSLIGVLSLFVAALQVTTLAAMALPAIGAPPEAPAWTLFTQAATPSAQAISMKAATLEGLVVKAGTNDPVSGAGVELSPVTGGAKPVAVAATNEGRFRFENVSPGEYRLAAARDGFVRSEFGQRAATGSGRTIVVKADQAPASFRLELVATGAISGIVRGRNGTPLENVQVQALKYGYKDGRRVLTTIRAVTTNDLGEYRLFWLPPAEYLVMATLLGAERGQRIIETMPGGGTATRMIGAPAGEAIVLPNDDASIPFYFPDTTDPLAADPVVVQAGSNRSSVNFNIVALAARRVRGVVLNMPANTSTPTEPFAPSARIRLQPRNPSVADESAPYGFSPIDRTSGAFEIRGVLPGAYDVVAGFGSLHGRTSIQVGAGDVDGVRVALTPDFELNAAVALEGGAANTDLSKLQIRLTPDYTGPARRQPSGVLQWRGVQAGTSYQVVVDQMPENGYVKSVRFGDLDMLSTPLQLDRAPGSPVEIVIGFGGSISGTLDGTTLESGATALIALIPNEPRRGRADLYKSIQSDSSGRFRMTGIAPGDYAIFAFENVEAGAWRHPDMIKRYEDRGKSIHVDEGSNLSTQLSVIP